MTVEYPETTEAAIKADNLRKTYGATKAVDGISFAVRTGEIFGMLGPNGAGKTTTIEMVEGLRKADAGAIEVLGLRQPHDARTIKSRIGIQLQNTALYPRLSVTEVIDLFRTFFAGRTTLPTDELIRLVDLEEKRGTRSKDLSGGQRQRLSVALALINDPDIVFLDEPTTGMDPQARRATWDMIRTVRGRGTTVLLTTHFMDEAERLADQIGILDNGQLVALDTPAALTQGATANAVRFTADPGLDLAALAALPTATAAHEETPGAYVIETADSPALLVELTTWLRQTGAGLRELRVGYGSLEDVFLRLTGKEIRD